MKKYSSEEIRKILEDVKTCAQLFCTKNNKVYSDMAEEFINSLGEYAKYCYPEMTSRWELRIRENIYGPLVPRGVIPFNDRIERVIKTRDMAIIDTLFNFINAGEIMSAYDETKSWEEIDRILDIQGHTGSTFSALISILILYWPLGVAFADRYDPTRKDINEKFKVDYEQAKEYQNTRTDLNNRLIRSLKKRCENSEK